MNFYAVFLGAELVAYYLAPSPVRAAWLCAGDERDAGARYRVSEIDGDQDLVAAAQAVDWREGRLVLAGASGQVLA